MTRRLLLTLTLAALWSCSTQPGETPGPDVEPTPAEFAFEFEEVPFPTEVTAPTEIAFVPGADELLVLRKDGDVIHYALGAEGGLTELGRFDVPGVHPQSDCGLIAAAFDPGFAENGYVYFGYCTEIGVNTVTRHVFDPQDYGKIASTASEVITATNPDAESNWHNVGSIQIGPDGVMWLLFGENNYKPAAQDTSTPVGALVRVVPERDPTKSGHAPAPGNPFIDSDDGEDPDIYAYGFRSPWRGHLDREGRFWIGDVGAAAVEELDLVTAPGTNYGWPDHEGPCASDCDGLVDPVSFWDREPDHPYVLDDPETSPTTRRAAWVGVSYTPGEQDRYEGKWDGQVLFGDFCTGWIRAANAGESGGLTQDFSVGNLVGIVSAAVGPDGYAYMLTYGNCRTFPYKPGKLYRAKLAPEASE